MRTFYRFIVIAILLISSTCASLADGTYYYSISGFTYKYNTESKTAILDKCTNDGDINVPEKINIKSNDYTVVALGDKCFYETGVTSVTIPNTITSLGSYCFAWCGQLKKVNIPSSVREIGSGCFYHAGVENLEIPSSITALPDRCFQSCDLKNVIIPETITILGEFCFAYTSLETIKLPSSISIIGKSCFKGSALKSIEIPQGVMNLQNTFEECKQLEKVTLPNGVTNLSGAFKSCENLKTVKIPEGVTNLNEAFYRCKKIINVTIPKSVTDSKSAFYDCESLASVTISDGVTYGSYIFVGCSHLKMVILEGKVKYKDRWGQEREEESEKPESYFGGVPLESCTLYVPNRYIQEYQNSNFWKVFGKILPLSDYKPTKTCDTPSISFANGEINFRSNTSGAKYHYTISTDDETSTEQETTGRVKLNAYYNIKVYATADGYEPSGTATATLYWLNGSIDVTNINNAKTRGIAVSSEDGFIRISGLSNRETVSFYSIDGKYLGRSQATDGVAIFSVSENLIIAKIGTDSIKIKTK